MPARPRRDAIQPPIAADHLSSQLLTAIRESLVIVSTQQGEPLTGARLEELARNVAQVAIGIVETFEAEDACPVCGRCPICGERGDHAH